MPNFEVQCKTCKSKTKVNSNVTPIKKGKRRVLVSICLPEEVIGVVKAIRRWAIQ